MCYIYYSFYIYWCKIDQQRMYHSILQKHRMIFIRTHASYLACEHDRDWLMHFIHGPRVRWKETLVEEYTTYSADEYDRKPMSISERTLCRNIDKFEEELRFTMQVIQDYQDDNDGFCENRVRFYISAGKTRYLNETMFAKYYKKIHRRRKKRA